MDCPERIRLELFLLDQAGARGGEARRTETCTGVRLLAAGGFRREGDVLVHCSHHVFVDTVRPCWIGVVPVDRIILNIPDVIRTGLILYNMIPKAKPHIQYDN